jgi:PRTRC genetic system protein A
MDKASGLEDMLVGHFVGRIPRGHGKPVSYVMCGNGLWEVRSNSLGVFRRHAAKMRIPGLQSRLEEGFELALPKIPLYLLWQAIAFFREVYGAHRSEAAVRVAYDRRRRRHLLDCPPQEVCAARCEFDRLRIPGDSVVVAEIHSHGRIGASFSGTDDRDELADRFYGVVGRVEDFFPEVNFRLSIGGSHLPVEIGELFDTGDDPMSNARFPADWLDRVRRAEPPAKAGRFGASRFLDDPDDPENADLLLPGWDPGWDQAAEADEEEEPEGRAWQALKDGDA